MDLEESALDSVSPTRKSSNQIKGFNRKTLSSGKSIEITKGSSGLTRKSTLLNKKSYSTDNLDIHPLRKGEDDTHRIKELGTHIDAIKEEELEQHSFNVDDINRGESKLNRILGEDMESVGSSRAQKGLDMNYRS